MKTQIKKIRVDGKQVWEWRILDGRKVLFGGMCATKKDAVNDASVVKSQNARTEPSGVNNQKTKI